MYLQVPWCLKNKVFFQIIPKRVCSKPKVSRPFIDSKSDEINTVIGVLQTYPLVNIQKAMENDHLVRWLTHQKLWFSIIKLNYQRALLTINQQPNIMYRLLLMFGVYLFTQFRKINKFGSDLGIAHWGFCSNLCYIQEMKPTKYHWLIMVTHENTIC